MARRLSIEHIIGIDTIERKTVARVALAIGPDALVSEACVCPGRVQQVRVYARAQNGELRKAACSQGCIGYHPTVQHVTGRRVRFIEQRR